MKQDFKKFGMTAIELVVILGILALLAAAVIPVMSNYLPGIQLSGATRTLTVSLREAQEKAVTEQDQYLIRFSPEATPVSYQMIKIDNAVEEVIRTEELPSSMSLTIEPTITGNQVVFSPDGGPSSSGDITLSLNSQSKVINVSPAGFIAIH